MPNAVHRNQADNFTSLPQLRAAVDRHAASAAGSVPMEVRILEGADHFFYERWEEVAAEALSWVAKQLEHVAQDGRMQAAASRSSGSRGSAAAAAPTL
jgi:alpha/beta superfamily hydrolase